MKRKIYWSCLAWSCSLLVLVTNVYASQNKEDETTFLPKRFVLRHSFLSKKRPVTLLEDHILQVTQAEPDVLRQVHWQLERLLSSYFQEDREIREGWKFLWQYMLKDPENLIAKGACRDLLRCRRDTSSFVLSSNHEIFRDLYQAVDDLEKFKHLLKDKTENLRLKASQHQKMVFYIEKLVQFYGAYRDRFIQMFQEGLSDMDILHFLEPKATLITQGSRFYRILQETAYTILHMDERGRPLLPHSPESADVSNHMVSVLPKEKEASLKVYFKRTGNPPLNPFTEFIVKSFYDLLEIPLPATEIVIIDRVKFDDHYNSEMYGLQASQGILGMTGKQLLRSSSLMEWLPTLDHTHYARQVIGALLTCPSDGKPDNFIHAYLGKGQYGFISIDNDEVFKSSLDKGRIYLKSLLISGS